MIDRRRLAVSGAALAAIAFVTHALLSWIDYQRALDASQSDNFEWVPNFWEYFRSGTGFALQFLVAIGLGLVVVAMAMRPADPPQEAPFRPEPPDDSLFRPTA